MTTIEAIVAAFGVSSLVLGYIHGLRVAAHVADDAFMEGKRARHDGATLDDNPHRYGAAGSPAVWWIRGWIHEDRATRADHVPARWDDAITRRPRVNP